MASRRCTWRWGGDNPVMIAALIEAGADVEARADHGWAPLHVAVARAALRAVVALVEAGADPDARADHGFAPAAHGGGRR